MKNIKELLDLSNKSAVVTGSAKGIGLGIAKRLHEAGANVVVSDVDEKSGKKITESLNNIRKDSAIFQKADVSSQEDVNKLIAVTVAAFGSLDIMVNNAGIFPFIPLAQLDESAFMNILEVNLKGVFLGVKSASEQMISQGKGGSIITVTSVDALHPSSIGLAAYDASKHGVWGFLKNTALELAPHEIRVNAVAPGGILTPGVEVAMGGKVNDATVENIPMKRLGEPEEIGNVVVFLASELSSYMTGSQIVADGGLLLS